MSRTINLPAVVAAVLSVSVCRPSRAVSLDMVTIGNPGNAADSTGFGAVNYTYRIGKYEVTNSQYTQFLNRVDSNGANSLALYNSEMANDARGGILFDAASPNGSKYAVKPGRGQNPVVFVSWFDAVRFTNWLHNGAGNGGTETGAYQFTGGTPIPSNRFNVVRSPGARWFLPNDDEWHKAAYHKNDGLTGNYWLYPTSSDIAPFSDQPPGTSSPNPANVANYVFDDEIANGFNDGFAVTGSPVFESRQNYLTDVGAYSLSDSPYGTFDQGGNVTEWYEIPDRGTVRGLRGGPWSINGAESLSSAIRGIADDNLESHSWGFRVANIPEPTALVLVLCGLFAGIMRDRKRYPARATGSNAKLLT